MQPMTRPHPLRSALFAQHGLIGVFTTRQGGISPPPGNSLNFAPVAGSGAEHVAENLRLLRLSTGLSRSPIRLRQVHGDRIIAIDERNPSGIKGDAMFTGQANLPLAIQTADCLPILLADPGSGLIAAIHAGWRGTALGIAAQTVRRLRRAGARAERILASVGPCIGPCCFTIDTPCAEALARRTEHQPFIRRLAQKFQADLAGMNIAQLCTEGLISTHIEHIQRCTCCEAEHFFSYRRDGDAAGRQLAVVVRPSCS